MNIAYRFRIYPNREQEVPARQNIWLLSFLYNQMLNDKIREYEATKKMLRNTPAMYKKAYPFLKEVDSLALARMCRCIWKRHIRIFSGIQRLAFQKSNQNTGAEKAIRQMWSMEIFR
ncbi:MAG: helix-turn-helix domain-containing protein [Lachnospiraceae bacterium]